MDEHLRMKNVREPGGSEHDRRDARLCADVLDCLARRDRPGGKDQHRHGPVAPAADGRLASLQAAAHAKADLAAAIPTILFAVRLRTARNI